VKSKLFQYSFFAIACSVANLAIAFAPPAAPPPVIPPAVRAMHKTGAIPLTKEQKAKRATGKWWKATEYPPQWSIVSPANSYFLNNTDGDCVLAGECVNINAHWYYVTGHPVIISDAEIQSYGEQFNLLNGAELLQVIGDMSIANSNGLTYTPSGGTVTTMYCDGVGSAVNYQNRASICSALASCQGSLKMAVASYDLQRVVGTTNGWYLGSSSSTNIDHNVEMVGYGPASYCFSVLSTPLPAGVDPTEFCYLVDTWSTIGVVNAAVVEASGWCNEIDMRSPTSIAITPSPTPAPNPKPGPTPTRRLAALQADVLSIVDQYQTGNDKVKARVLSLLDDVEKRVDLTRHELGLAK